MTDPDAGVREEAIRGLSDVDDERVLDPLVNALKDPEPRLREMAGEALVRWSSPAVARRLVEALTSPSLRRQAGDLLARIGTSVVDPLLRLIGEGDQTVASTMGGDTLERLVGPDVLLERLGSMDPSERLAAVEALGVLGGLQGVEGLVQALSDPNEQVRLRSLQLLGDLGDPRATDALERTVHADPVAEVVSAAEAALRRIRSQ